MTPPMSTWRPKWSMTGILLIAFISCLSAGSHQIFRSGENQAQTRQMLQVAQGGDPTFNDDVWPIILRYITPQDHMQLPGVGMFSMPDSPSAYVNLVNQPSTQLPAMNLVEPGDSQNSYLWQKIAAGSQRQGLPMPVPPDGPMTDDEIATITSWIDSGAVFALDQNGNPVIPTSTSRLRGGNIVTPLDSFYLSLVGTFAVLALVFIYRKVRAGSA